MERTSLVSIGKAHPLLLAPLGHETCFVPSGRARAREIAKDMAGLSPVALACAKHAVYAGADVDLKSGLSTGLSMKAEAFLRAASSDDARAASRAYVAVPFEKRQGWMESSESLPDRAK